MSRSSSRTQREDGKKSRLISGKEQQNTKQHYKARIAKFPCNAEFPKNAYCSDLAVATCRRALWNKCLK